MKEFPPMDFLAAGWARRNAPKSLSDQASKIGKIKKGKVKRRGN